jgi:hypothetical protein
VIVMAVVAGRGLHATVDTNDPRSLPVPNREPSQVQNIPKLIRLVHTVFLMVDKTPAGPWDEPTRQRLATTWTGVVGELKDAVVPEAGNELDRLLAPLGDGTPTEGELRIEQAQIAAAWAESVDQQREVLQALRSLRAPQPDGITTPSPYL